MVFISGVPLTIYFLLIINDGLIFFPILLKLISVFPVVFPNLATEKYISALFYFYYHYLNKQGL